MKGVPAKLLPKVVGALIILIGMMVAHMKKNEGKLVYKCKDSKIAKSKDSNPPKNYQSIDKDKFTLETLEIKTSDNVVLRGLHLI